MTINEFITKITVENTDVNKLIRQLSKGSGKVYSRSEVIQKYKDLCKEESLQIDEKVIHILQMKPMRTQSGVAPVTVLTRPFECPGLCIFCPTDVRMPKSYLRNEPGAQRAEHNHFDPYLQVYNRLRAFEKLGHSTDKVELLILGGTWSFYPKDYQVWFIKRCLDAMNDNGSEYKSIKDIEELDTPKLPLEKLYLELFDTQRINTSSLHREVGLVIETRPDYINEEEVIHLRTLGVTKVQLGIQSMNNKVLDLNKRGHHVKESVNAIRLLRLAGFKIQIHWMPNLYGSTPNMDKKDFLKLFNDNIQPDELKIYPCSVLKNAELYSYFKKGLFKPYSTEVLVEVLVFCLKNTPEYVRINRLIRDIPSTDIVEGNKFSNLRQVVENKVNSDNFNIKEIRFRELKLTSIKRNELKLRIIKYDTNCSVEYFLSFVTKQKKIAGFLRLSLPQKELSLNHFIEELKGSAIIREVHVYGRVVSLGKKGSKTSQHLGLGKELIKKAEEISVKKGFNRLSIISAIGTKLYYNKSGYKDGKMYQYKEI